MVWDAYSSITACAVPAATEGEGAVTVMFTTWGPPVTTVTMFGRLLAIWSSTDPFELLKRLERRGTAASPVDSARG